MKPFLDADFLLDGDTAQKLYHQVAQKLPIVDYHCHIDPREIAEDRVFYNLAQLWLEGDHYKWRLMRANGVAERCITGDASDYEKFEQWAATLEKAVGNPLYHWSHLELQRYFGYNGVLNKANAQAVWDHCQQVIGSGMRVRDILQKSNVTLLCTTDDPTDTLEWHRTLAADTALETKVLPAFRPDKAVNLEKDTFEHYIEKLSVASGILIDSWDRLTAALDNRLDFFAQNGCTLSDHGLDNLHYLPADTAELDAILKKRLSDEMVTETEMWQYKSGLLEHLAREYARRGWVMQLHFAAQRDNNTAMFHALGPDTGYDSIGPGVDLRGLAAFLDTLERSGKLPKTVLYSLAPGDNAALVSLMGCYQGGGVPGKMQHGSAWWFNDHKPGMEAQLSTLANEGLLGNFIGMLTDSRSFLSYTRHEYFRRILCNLIGGWVDRGEFPNDPPALERLVADISYHNTVRYFGWQHHHLRGAQQA